MRRLSILLALLLTVSAHAGRTFNGSSNVITANGIGSALDISSGNETVSGWAYITTTSPTAQVFVAHYAIGTSGGQFIIGLGIGSGTSAQVGWGVGCCGSVTGESYDVCSTPITTLNKWYQFVMWSNNGVQTGMLMNGGSFCNAFTAWDGAVISAGGQNFTIGNQGGGTNFFSSGTIAEVAVWNQKLPLNFLIALGTICPAGPSARRMGFPAPVGYFPLTGASGSSIEPDLSGNKLNGTLTGTSAGNHPPCTP